MAMTIPLFYVIIYPVLSLLCAQVFADMSDVKREIRRLRETQRQSEAAAEIKASFKPTRLRFHFRRSSPYDLNPHLRILLNASVLVLLYEGVMLVYIALVGIQINFGHFLRALYVMIYTAVCCVSMFPARAWLGLYRKRRSRKADFQREEITTDRELLRKMALVPDEAPQAAKKPFRFLHRKQNGPKNEPADNVAVNPENSGEEGREKDLED
jgi:hypothetical protein